MTQDNDWYLKALHWGNEGHHAWASSQPRGRSKVLTVDVFKQKKGGTNPRILMDWLNVKWLHYRHSKMVEWLNQIEHILWGNSRKDLQKIGQGCMNYHLFQMDSQSVFSKKKKNQNHKIGKECHEHCTTFHYSALFHIKSAFTQISQQRLHAFASLKIMLTA